MPEVLVKGKIRLELVPWVSETCGSREPGRLILDESIEEGATIGTLLRKIASEHPAFRQAVLDPSGERLSSDVSVVLNGRLLDLLGGMNTPLRDGDTVLLLPFIDGG